ncbi:unnamed protein product [Cochlearia groenlandica]
MYTQSQITIKVAEEDKTRAKKETMINNNNEEASSSSSLSSSSSSSSVSSSSSSSSSVSSSKTKRVSRVPCRLRNPPVRLGLNRRSVNERQAEVLALPLGMSFAAFTNLVLERKSVSGQNVYVDDLAMISASVVKESLANVYGHNLGSFATNFERSFNSTFKILKLINESAFPDQSESNNVESFSLNRSSTIEESSETKETSSLMNEIVLLHEETRHQLSIVPNSLGMSLTTFERSLEEQARANDLKTMEINLSMRKLMLKETELALSYESNNLMRSKIDLGVSKAAFEAEKFKTELEDTRKAEMVTKIMDCLVGSVVVMSCSMLYGAHVFSKQRIEEVTSICQGSKESSSSSWWILQQVSSMNTEFNMFICRVRVWVKFLFGVVMIFFFTYFVIKRSSSGHNKQIMPVTLIVLLLGVVCGLTGKLCVDTLDGNGKLWLCLWEVFCLLHFMANVYTLGLCGLMYGPIEKARGGTKPKSLVPYWLRRGFAFVLVVLVFPLVNGLLPFATFGEWRNYLLSYLNY